MIMAQKCSVIFGWMIMNKQDIDICTLLWNLRKMKFWTLELVFASPFYLVLLLHTERKIFFLILTLSFVIALFTHSLGMQPLRIETFYDMLLWYLYKVQLCTAIFLICVNKSYERKLTFKKRHKKSINSRNLSHF